MCAFEDWSNLCDCEKGGVTKICCLVLTSCITPFHVLCVRCIIVLTLRPPSLREQYVRCTLVMQGKDKSIEADLPPEAVNVLIFLQEFCKFSGLERKVVQDHLPPYVFDKHP